VTDTIPAGGTKAYENAGETLFHALGVLGAARVRSARALLVSARVYNLAPGQTDAASQGLFSSGIPADFGISNGQSGLLQGVRQSADFRYNLFFVETGGGSFTADERSCPESSPASPSTPACKRSPAATGPPPSVTTARRCASTRGRRTPSTISAGRLRNKDCGRRRYAGEAAGPDRRERAEEEAR
jgi:hypothetical protein